MTAQRPEEPEAILDRALDRLLEGADWQGEIPPDHPDREELLQLMTTAEHLAQVFGRRRTSAPERLRQVWRRVVDRTDALRG